MVEDGSACAPFLIEQRAYGSEECLWIHLAIFSELVKIVSERHGLSSVEKGLGARLDKQAESGIHCLYICSEAREADKELLPHAEDALEVCCDCLRQQCVQAFTTRKTGHQVASAPALVCRTGGPRRSRRSSCLSLRRPQTRCMIESTTRTLGAVSRLSVRKRTIARKLRRRPK